MSRGIVGLLNGRSFRAIVRLRTPATAHLHIVNPLVGRSVARLEQMAMSGDYLVR